MNAILLKPTISSLFYAISIKDIKMDKENQIAIAGKISANFSKRDDQMVNVLLIISSSFESVLSRLKTDFHTLRFYFHFDLLLSSCESIERFEYDVEICLCIADPHRTGVIQSITGQDVHFYTFLLAHRAGISSIKGILVSSYSHECNQCEHFEG